MLTVLTALGLIALGGFAAWPLSCRPRPAGLLAAGSCVAGASLALSAVLPALGKPAAEPWSFPWPTVPGAALTVALDPLSALFLLPIFVVAPLVALALVPSLEADGKPAGLTWAAFNALVAGMGLTVLAGNALLFLVAWEVMSLAAFFLVARHHEDPAVRSASWTYLAGAHLGAGFLLALFALLGQACGSLEFTKFASLAPQLSPGLRTLLFLLALVGFGTKAGIWPLHSWLPDTYAAAPGPVPAVLSGVMSKLGFYGLLRVLAFLGPGEAGWSWLLIALGVLSGLFGILNALARADLKRVLAYSSVENAGIILLGLGIGLLGGSAARPTVALLGLTGAVLHILNHSACKGLLFVASAAVEQKAGTLELDRLGGLLRKAPLLAACFLLGATAISGLPPFNAFASEFLIYLGAFEETSLLGTVTAVPPLLVIAGLALIGALAAACFARASGIVFLGEPRSAIPENGPTPPLLTFSLCTLAAGCVALALASPVVATALLPAVGVVSGSSVEGLAEAFHVEAVEPLNNVVRICLVFSAILGALVALRWWLLRGREVGAAGTWGCGYTAPTVRMQYTASSFAQPLIDVFGALLLARKEAPVIKDYFPVPGARVQTDVPDQPAAILYQPSWSALKWFLASFRWLQSGRVQLYVLYIVLALLVLLIAFLGG